MQLSIVLIAVLVHALGRTSAVTWMLGHWLVSVQVHDTLLWILFRQVTLKSSPHGLYVFVLLHSNTFAIRDLRATWRAWFCVIFATTGICAPRGAHVFVVSHIRFLVIYNIHNIKTSTTITVLERHFSRVFISVLFRALVCTSVVTCMTTEESQTTAYNWCFPVLSHFFFLAIPNLRATWRVWLCG